MTLPQCGYLIRERTDPMALFSPKGDVCAVCGGSCGRGSIKARDKAPVCKDCRDKADEILPYGVTDALTGSDYARLVRTAEAQPALLERFRETREVGGFLHLDEAAKLWHATPRYKKKPVVHAFSDITGYELIEDGVTVTGGGLGTAVAGGLLFGGAGAVAGAVIGPKKSAKKVSKIELKITLSDLDYPVEHIWIMDGGSGVKTDSKLYQKALSVAQDCLSCLQTISEEGQREAQAPASAVSPAEELMQWKQLLDQGILSQEEFDAKKRQLLGL